MELEHNPGNCDFCYGTSSTSQNPEIMFDDTGSYTVQLTVTNTIGSDSETKVDYITIVDNEPLNLPFLEGFENVGPNISFTSSESFLNGSPRWSYEKNLSEG
jgi:PKD repeat protein